MGVKHRSLRVQPTLTEGSDNSCMSDSRSQLILKSDVARRLVTNEQEQHGQKRHSNSEPKLPEKNNISGAVYTVYIRIPLATIVAGYPSP